MSKAWQRGQASSLAAAAAAAGYARNAHRPLLGTVRSFQMVTSATAQLLSNMAMGALKSCSSGGPDPPHAESAAEETARFHMAGWKAAHVHACKF
jgi:hypothetical protein